MDKLDPFEEDDDGSDQEAPPPVPPTSTGVLETNQQKVCTRTLLHVAAVYSYSGISLILTPSCTSLNQVAISIRTILHVAIVLN